MVKQCAIGKDAATLAPLASPTFTGAPAAVTAAVGTNTTQIATTAFTLANAHTFVKLAASDTLRGSYDTEQSFTHVQLADAANYFNACVFALPPNITMGSVVRVKCEAKVTGTTGSGYVLYYPHAGFQLVGVSTTARSITTIPTVHGTAQVTANTSSYVQFSTDVTVNAAHMLGVVVMPDRPTLTVWIKNIRIYSTDGTVTAPGWT